MVVGLQYLQSLFNSQVVYTMLIRYLMFVNHYGMAPWMKGGGLGPDGSGYNIFTNQGLVLLLLTNTLTPICASDRGHVNK